MTRLVPPTFEPLTKPTLRLMTASEIMMARAVGAVITKKHPRCSSMRLLHGRALSENQRYIAEHEAETLRRCVKDLASQLQPHVVELAAGVMR